MTRIQKLSVGLSSIMLMGVLHAQVSDWVVTDTNGGASGSSRTSTGIVYTGAGNDGFAAANLDQDWVIAGAGDSITLSFDVSLAGIADQNNGFLFGVYNSNGTKHTGDITGINNPDYRDEYGFTWRLHSGSTNGQNRVDIMNSAQGVTGSNTLTTFNTAAVLDTDNTQPGGIKLASTTYSVTVNLLGTATGIELSGSIFDGTDTFAIPGVDGNATSTNVFGNSFTVDTLAFSLSNNIGSETATISNVSVIPEPSSLALIGLALVSVAGMHRLKRR